MPQPVYYASDPEELIDASSIGAGSTIVGQGSALTSGQQNIAGGMLAEGSSSTPIVVGPGAAVGDLSIVQESPEALALSASAFEGALNLAEAATGGILNLTAKQQAEAAETVRQSIPGNRLLVGGAILAAAVVAYFIFRGKR